MKLAFGTYGMPGVAPEDALTRIAEIGYRGLELCIGDRYGLEPAATEAAQRQRLRAMFRDLGLALPAVMMHLAIMSDKPGAHEDNLAQFRRGAELTAELTEGRQPVLTTTVAGSKAPWDAMRDELLRRLEDYAPIAEQTGCVLAIEPHVGGGFDQPERADWTMRRLASPWVRCNFDISHFAVQGRTIADCVPAMVPHAAHVHVKDGRMENGKVLFLLPGEGDFDYAEYFRAMAAAGWDDFVTVEVSGMVSKRPNYDPYETARFCHRTLSAAMHAASVGQASRLS